MPEQKYPKPPDISFSAKLVWEEESPAHLSSERKRPTKLTTHPQSIPHVAVASLDRLFHNTEENSTDLPKRWLLTEYKPQHGEIMQLEWAGWNVEFCIWTDCEIRQPSQGGVQWPYGHRSSFLSHQMVLDVFSFKYSFNRWFGLI
ncbi:hypothetical protein G6F37_010449 [Rhizopus arrhizus]|nr:hypothetical protein G6F38_006675 [Rhizopus arrhizus]KAG1153335.1 hypothetical protein G6F37_010449 [Rhizopus arrhizus]